MTIILLNFLKKNITFLQSCDILAGDKVNEAADCEVVTVEKKIQLKKRKEAI